MARRRSRNVDELPGHMSSRHRDRLTELADLLDAFCDQHLNDEYKELCREMAVTLCRKRLPIDRGKTATWASGVVYALGSVNFLSDPAQIPCMTTAEIALGFGVSESALMSKSKTIREALRLQPLHPAWTLPSRLFENPLVWMVQLSNGIVIDIRMAPYEVQKDAYEQGLIPFIPSDQPPDSLPAEDSEHGDKAGPNKERRIGCSDDGREGEPESISTAARRLERTFDPRRRSV